MNRYWNGDIWGMQERAAFMAFIHDVYKEYDRYLLRMLDAGSSSSSSSSSVNSSGGSGAGEVEKRKRRRM